tara:strand:- start:5019 stop:5930 length:912 start_codon:yes stop_codon:yes gene_type:complete
MQDEKKEIDVKDKSETSDSKKNLGRGLSALLGDEAKDLNALSKLRGAPKEIPIEFLNASEFQPRTIFSEKNLEELSNSIKTHGILQPILVRKSISGPEQYEIIAGERRWRAAQKAGLERVPVIIKEFSDSQLLEVAIIENIQREDLSAIEEAIGYKNLLEKFSYTQSAISKITGSSRSHIANTLRLLNLPLEVQEYIKNGSLSAGHGRALLAVDDPILKAKEIIKENLNVRKIEKLNKNKKDKKTNEIKKDSNTIALEKNLSDALGYKVNINFQNANKGGKIQIEYRTLEQLDDIVHRLLSPK